MKVPLLDVTREQESHFAAMREVFDRVMTSGRYILGPEVEGLESECAAYVGAEHAIGVSSGSDALLVALMALDVGPGDEVVCPTYTFFATAGAVWRLGAKPVLVDCDRATWNCRAVDIEPALTARTKAILPVHLFGQCCDMGPILELAERRGIPVVEDAAQAIGATWRGRGAGSMGTIGCFSFYPTKNLGALGDAGLVTTNDAGLAARMRILRMHGMEPKYYHCEVGGNFRIDALQAALLRIKLPHLEASQAARRRNAVAYDRLFEGADLVDSHVSLPVGDRTTHTFNQYVIRVLDGRRDALRAHLGEVGIGTEVYYPVPMHLQECFASLGHRNGDFPVAEQGAAETLALPIFPGLSDTELREVVTQIAAFLRAGTA